MRAGKWQWAALAFVMTACSEAGTTAGGAGDCLDDLPIGTVSEFSVGLPNRTEGLTFGADGRLYASVLADGGAPDTIVAIAPDGSFAAVGTTPSALGLARLGNELLVAGIETGALYRFDPATGDYATVATGLGAPNFVVTAPTGTILVSDDSFGVNRVSEVTPAGETSVWTADVPSPNGMAFAADGGALYVVATFEGEGLYRVAVDAAGRAGDAVKIVDLPGGSTPDGLARDTAGNFYVALNLAGEIARVSPSGQLTTVATGVRGVASLALGQGTYDRCSLYATNLLGDVIWRIAVGPAPSDSDTP